MVSSIDAFSGISAADIAKLFGTGSPSSSSLAPASTAAAQAETITVSVSSASAKAVQAIVTQAQVTRAQAATAGATISASVQAAYADQTGATSLLSANVTVSAPAGASSDDNGFSWKPYTAIFSLGEVSNEDGGDPSSLLGARVTLSPDASSNADLSGVSFVVATANGLVGAGVAVVRAAPDFRGDGGPGLVAVAGSAAKNSIDDAVDFATDALKNYQGGLYTAQEELANPQSLVYPTGGGVPATSDEASASAGGSSYLELSITADADSTTVETKAQQLVDAFKNHTLAPESSGATGFSYSEFGANGNFNITGIEVHSSTILGWRKPANIPTVSQYASKDLIDSSTVLYQQLSGSSCTETLRLAVRL